MRTIVIALAIAAAGVPAAQAQDLAVPAHEEQRDTRMAEPTLFPVSSELVPVTAEMVPHTENLILEEEAAVAQAATARNFFTVVGVIVVAVALIALFR